MGGKLTAEILEAVLHRVRQDFVGENKNHRLHIAACRESADMRFSDLPSTCGSGSAASLQVTQVQQWCQQFTTS